jgi:hypothetical protein
MQLLVGRQMQPVIHHPHIYRTYRIRTFGYHYGIGGQGAVRQIAERTPRQHMIVDIQMIVRREQYRKPASQGPVLHRVIQYHYIQLRYLAHELLYAAYAVLAYRYRNFGEFAMELHRFITDRIYR